MNYSFTLILDNLSDITEEQVEMLFQVGCNDCTPGVSKGVVGLDFDRDAPSFEEAVSSAIRDARKVFGQECISVE